MEEITQVCDQGEESEKCMDQRDKKVPEAYSHTPDKSGLDTDTSFNDSAYVNDGGGEMLDTSCKQGQNSVRGVTSDLCNTFHKESHKKCNEMSDNIDIKLVPEDGLDCSLSNEKEEFSYRSFMKKDDSGIDIGRSPTSIKEMSVASDIDNSEISESFTESSINSRDNSDSVSDTFTDSGAVKDASDSVSDSISDIGAVLKENSDSVSDSINDIGAVLKENSDSVSDSINDIRAVLKENSDSVSDSINDIGAVLKENSDSVSDSISVRVAVMEENQNIDRSHVVDKKTKKSDKFCDSVPETVTNNKDDDYMPQSIDTEDSDPCGYYDVTMSSAKDSEDEMESAFKATSKTKRKFRRPRIDSNSDTDSNPGDELHQSSLDSNTDTDSNMDESSLRLKNRESAHDSDDEEKLDSKKDSDEDDDEEDEDNYVDPANKKPTHLWKALYDIREREMGYSNKSPPSVFREKVQGSVQMVQRFKLQTKMEYHEGCVNALHFNRIGTLLASGSDDLNIVLWNWIRSRPALIYDSGHRSNVFQAKFMPFSGDCHVVSCARDGQIRLAELSLTGVCKGTKKLAQHRGAAHKLALEFDSPHVFLSCGEDALVYEIDLRQEKPNKLSLTKESDRKVPLYSIHSNPSNSYEFCVGGRDHFIRIYDKRKIGSEEKETGLVKKYCPDHLVDSDVKANVTCAVYNYNGTEVMGSYNDEDIYLFSNQHSDGAEYIHKYSGHRNNATVKGVNFYGPKSEFVVTGSDCGHIYLWDRESETVVQFLEGDEGGVINVLEPHPFAPVLATSGLDHDVKIWSPTAEEPTKLKGLKKVLNRNKKERDEERSNEPDMLDGQMLWYIMHQLRRVRRRNEQRGGGGDGDDRDNDSSSSDNSDMDSDGMEEMPDRLQCAPS